MSEHVQIIVLMHELVELNKLILAELRKDQLPVHASMSKTTNQDLLDKLVDSVDAKNHLHISSSTLYRLTKNGMIPSIRIGNRNYYNTDDLVRLKDFYSS